MRVALVCLMALVARPAGADIINVPDDYPTIQAAINAAQDGDEVVVAPGTYVESITFWPKVITVRSTDPEDPDIVASTIIQPDTGRAVWFEPEAGLDTVLTGFTITDGHSAYGGGAYMWNTSPTIANCIFTANSASYTGGAMYIGTDSSPMIDNCTFTDNSSSGYHGGGAMYIESGSATIVACTFRNNSATEGGGAVKCYYAHDVTVIDCSFTENWASGGGAFCEDNGTSTIVGCVFVQNSAEWVGGAVDSGNSTLTMADCTFEQNGAGLEGGGMSIMSLADEAMVTGCTFTGNTASDFGGGLLGCAGVLTVQDCKFSANWAVRGGGMACLYPDFSRGAWAPRKSSDPPGYVVPESANTYAGHVDACTFISNTAVWGAGLYHNAIWSEPTAITRCTFRENQADADGGGMVCRHITEATVSGCAFLANRAAGSGGGLCNMDNWAISSYDISNCTFTANTAGGNGGGMFNADSDVTIANCILWGDGSDEIYNLSSSPVVSYCNVQAGYEGEGNIDADPLFVDSDNADYRLSPGSPCIDAADNTAVPPDELDLDEDGDTEEPIPFDLDGSGRFINDPCTTDTGNGDPPLVDMGAYEFQPPCPCDLDCDGDVATADLLMLLGAWGTGLGDVDGDGDTDTADLLALLGAWGECPM